jgi:hypothetical protein
MLYRLCILKLESEDANELSSFADVIKSSVGVEKVGPFVKAGFDIIKELKKNWVFGRN